MYSFLLFCVFSFLKLSDKNVKKRPKVDKLWWPILSLMLFFGACSNINVVRKPNLFLNKARQGSVLLRPLSLLLGVTMFLSSGVAFAQNLLVNDDNAPQAPYCTTTGLQNFTSSQLSGTNDGLMEVGEVFLYEDVASDATGNSADLRIEVVDIAASAVGSVGFDTASGNLAILNTTTPNVDPYVAVKMSIIVAGSATASNLTGVPAVLNNTTFELLDIDSQFASADQTDVGGYSTAQGDQPGFVLTIDTVALPFQNGGGPANFNTYLQTPIIDANGDPTWSGVDKGDPRDNYVSLNYSQLTEAVFLHGSTGPRDRGGERGASFAICGDLVVPPATLTLEKTVINDDAGTALDTEWTLQATDGTTTISGSEGSTDVTSASVPAATYTLSESGPAGYTQTSLTCTGAADTDLSDGLTLAGGENVTCTFVNDDLPPDTIARPTQCGAWNHHGWITAGTSVSGAGIQFGSGDPVTDPYVFLPLKRDASNRVLSYLGTPDETLSGFNPTLPGSQLSSTAPTATDHKTEYHLTVYRLEGVPGASETITVLTASYDEYSAYWVENTSGSVVSSGAFLRTNNAGVGQSFPVTVNYGADGIAYLYLPMFDPDALYGPVSLPDYSCSDFGDAPNSYGTDKTSGGAEHGVISDVYLGSARPDTESDGVAVVAANSDDTNAGGDDEDGVAILPPLTPADRNYRITVNATNTTTKPGRLIAWIDFDGNGTFDADEAAARVVPAGTNAGNFIVAWSSIPADIQAGTSYMRLRFTTDAMNANDATGFKLDGEVEDHALTIGDPGPAVSGRVYIDANSSATEDAGEAGIGGTVVVLYDTTAGTCRSATTNGNGDYSFLNVANGNYEIYQAHGETTPVPQNCGMANVANPTGYQSTTPDTLSVTVTGAAVNDQDFGEVAGANSPTTGNTGVGIRFEPDHQSEVLPGNVVFYAHAFSSEAEGAVRFTTSASGNSTAGWTSTLYRDINCNGVLDGTEGNTPINGINFGIAAGGKQCIIDKVYAPANAPQQDRYELETTATFTFAGGAPAPIELKVKDITTTGQQVSPTTSAAPEQGASRLKLRKTVENITQSTPETETNNQAKPGDKLKYRIYYRNTGTGPITDLEVNDTVPVFTRFVVGSESCDTTPTGLACTPNRNLDDLNWDFTGSLPGGAEGSVSYEVVLDN